MVLLRIAAHFIRLSLIEIESRWRVLRVDRHLKLLERHNAEIGKLQTRLSELGPFVVEKDH